MKNYFLFVLIAISACTSSKKNIDANAELAKAQIKVPGITIEQLSLGKKIYIRDCTGCHALKKPAIYTVEQWQPILKKMFVKAKVADSTERKLIADYVIAKSK